jgi:hypothetical protein
MRATSFRLLTLLGFGITTAAEARAESSPSCVLQDVTAPAANTEFFASASGGSATAKFTGASLALRMSELPADFASGARARVETGDGKTPSIRVKGWASPNAFRYFAREHVPLAGVHGRLTKGLEIVPLAVREGALEFEHTILGTRGADGGPMKLRGSLPCSAVALAPPGVDAAEPPKGARWYHMRVATLRLFDKPQGNQVLEMRMDANAARIFWSSEPPRAGWLHVISPGDVTLDGWVKQVELETQPFAEVIDMQLLAPRPLASPNLALAEPPKTMTATVELPILSKAETGAAPLGVVEVGATFYGMDVSTEWTSVVPTSLALMPVDGAGFWVKSASLPKP